MPSSPTVQTHQHNHSLDTDSPSNPPGFLEEETLEFQEEYPQEVVEEAEEEEEVVEVEITLWQLHCKEPQMQGTN